MSAPEPGAHERVPLRRGLIVLFAFCCGALVANLYLAQPILGLIAPDLGLSARAAGLIVALTQAGYALGMLFLVPLGDLLENRRLMMLTTAVCFVGLAGTALATTVPVFFAVTLLVGIGTASVQMIIPLTAHLAPEATRGRVVGNVMSGLLLGIMLARPLASFVADAFGWRTVFAGAAVMALAVEIAFAFTMPRRQPQQRASYGALLLSLGTLLRRQPVLRRRCFGQACMFASFILFWTAVPLELTQVHGFSQTQIAIFALVGAMGAVSAPIGGRLADAGHTRIATLVLMSVATLAYLPGLLGSATTGIGTLVVTGIAIDFCVQMNMVLSQREVYALDATSRGRITSLLMTSVFIGGAFGAAIAAWLFAHGGWRWAAAAGAALPLVGLLHFLATTFFASSPRVAQTKP